MTVSGFDDDSIRRDREGGGLVVQEEDRLAGKILWRQGVDLAWTGVQRGQAIVQVAAQEFPVTDNEAIPST